MKGSHTYELIVAFAPSLEAKQSEALFASIADWVLSAGGTVSKKHSMGTKELAYPISGHNKADFYTFDIHAEVGMKLAELNLSLNRNPSIIRYMVSKTN